MTSHIEDSCGSLVVLYVRRASAIKSYIAGFERPSISCRAARQTSWLLYGNSSRQHEQSALRRYLYQLTATPLHLCSPLTHFTVSQLLVRYIFLLLCFRKWERWFGGNVESYGKTICSCFWLQNDFQIITHVVYLLQRCQDVVRTTSSSSLSCNVCRICKACV